MDTQTDEAHITTSWAVDYCHNMTLSFRANYPETEVGSVFLMPFVLASSEDCFLSQSPTLIRLPEQDRRVCNDGRNSKLTGVDSRGCTEEQGYCKIAESTCACGL